MDEKAGASRAKGQEANSGPGQLVSMEGKPESPERDAKPPGSGARVAGASSQPGQPGTTTPTPSATKEQQVMTQATLGERDKAIKILAKSIFRELKMNGYETRQIVALSSELLGLVTSTIKPEGNSGNG